jgi:hypothetical protein
MRIKFEAVDKNGKPHKRASVSRLYSHCVVIHFAAHPPSKFWPKGVTAFSRAEWAGSLALAERSASRWRKEPDVEAIEDPRGEASVMPFPKVRSPKPSRPRSPRDDCSGCRTVLAATNKSLAQSNKSGADGKATKQREAEHIGH